jgi:outer membrane autotransporter protein
MKISAPTCRLSTRRKTLAQAIYLAFTCLTVASSASAATYTVTALTDDGSGTTPGTLSAAINQANAGTGNIIAVDSSVSAITLSGALPAITQPVTLMSTQDVQIINGTLTTTGSGAITLGTGSAFIGMAGAAGPNFNSWWPSPSNAGANGSAALTGVNLTASNNAVLTGGKGGNGGNNTGYWYDGGYGADGGLGAAGFTGSAYTLNNTGTITGGAGGDGGAGARGVGSGGGGGAGGLGGAAVTGTNFTLTNSGTISGGVGGNGGIPGTGASNRGAGAGGAGGAGLSGSDFTLNNSGTIIGGAGGTGMTAGTGGVGVVATGNSTIYNAGTISGMAGSNAISLSNGGNQLVLDAGSVINGNVVSSSGAVNGGDTLTLGGSGNGSLNLADIGVAAQYQGFANFSKAGNGTWTLAGTGSSSWNVTAGTLALADNAVLTGTVTVLSGARFTPATATIAGGIVNAGTVSIAAGKTLTVDSFINTGTFSTSVAGMTNYGKLNVTGAAALGGALYVDAAAASALAAGSLANVISAGSLTGTFASYNTNSLLFTFTPVYNANGVDLTVAAAAVTVAPPAATPAPVADPVAVVPVPAVPAPVAEPAPVSGPSILGITKALGNVPAAGAAATLDRILASDAAGPVASMFYGFTKGQERQVSNAVSQTLPLLTGNSMTATYASLNGINRLVQARMEANRGLSSGNGFYGDKNVWLKPFGSWANQHERNGVAGYTAETYGLVGGIDRVLSPALRIGGAFAYAKTNVDGKSEVAAQTAGLNLYQLVGYGSYSIDDRTEMNLQLDAGRNNNQGRRQIAFASAVASSSYSSQSAHLGLGLARSYVVGARTSFIPAVRADYTWVRDDGYTEGGAGALNLLVNGRTTQALVLGVDGKLSHQLSERTTLTANLGTGYNTLDRNAAIVSAYAGAPTAAFVTYGITPSAWLTRGGIGAVYKAANGVEVTGRYDVEHREGFVNQAVSAKVRWAF